MIIEFIDVNQSEHCLTHNGISQARVLEWVAEPQLPHLPNGLTAPF